MCVCHSFVCFSFSSLMLLLLPFIFISLCGTCYVKSYGPYINSSSVNSYGNWTLFCVTYWKLLTIHYTYTFVDEWCSHKKKIRIDLVLNLMHTQLILLKPIKIACAYEYCSVLTEINLSMKWQFILSLLFRKWDGDVVIVINLLWITIK